MSDCSDVQAALKSCLDEHVDYVCFIMCQPKCFRTTRGTITDGFSGQFFPIFEMKRFCFVVAISDPVYDVEAIFHLP